jgi:hypothetical protein
MNYLKLGRSSSDKCFWRIFNGLLRACREARDRLSLFDLWLQAVEERDDLALLCRRQIHLEALIIEVENFVEIARGAVVEVGRASRETA